MAGIFGLQDYTGSKCIASVAEELRAAAKGNLNLPSDVYSFTNSAIGFALPNTYSNIKRPLVSRDRKYALVGFGEIYLPSGTPLKAANFDDDFLAPLLSAKEDFLRNVDGNFIFALMSEDECMLANDPFGNFTLFYTSSPGLFAFSCQMTALRHLASQGSLDNEAVLEHLALSQTLSGRTLYHNIMRLRRGTVIHSSKAGVQETEYITRSFHPVTDWKPELEKVRLYLTESVRRACSSPNTTAALSGGFDSRLTWSMILSQGLESKIVPSTHGVKDARDMEIATTITNRLALKHDRLVFDDAVLHSLPSLWRDFVTLTEGLLTFSQIHTFYALKHLQGRFEVLIDSFGGAIHRRQIKRFIEPRIDPKRNIAEQVLFTDLTPLAKSAFLRQDIKTEMRKLALIRLNEYYSKIEHIAEPGNKFDLYYMDQTASLRDSAGANLQMNFIGVAQPLLDRRAAEAVSHIPIDFRRNEGVHKYIIHKSFPGLEDFWVENSGYKLPYRGFANVRLAPYAINLLLNKAAKFIPPLRSVSLRKPPIDAKDILKPGLPLAKEILFSSHPLYDTLINRKAIEQEFSQLENGNFNNATATIQLLTFRMFLDIFEC